jgi:hypothetical protein
MSNPLPPNKNVYYEWNGCNLLNPENYPKGVRIYLNREKEILSHLKAYFKTLVEVGCFDGRYNTWCAKHHRQYIGIDINDRYLTEATRLAEFYNLPKSGYEFHNLNAQNLIDIQQKSPIFQSTSPNDLLVIFPFNCLGNIANVIDVIDSLNRLGISYYISNFNVTSKATKVRETYYNNCEFDAISKHGEKDGIRFQSPDGLNSIAYDYQFLIENFSKPNPYVRIFDITSIGIGTVNINRLFSPILLFK